MALEQAVALLASNVSCIHGNLKNNTWCADRACISRRQAGNQPRWCFSTCHPRYQGIDCSISYSTVVARAMQPCHIIFCVFYLMILVRTQTNRDFVANCIVSRFKRSARCGSCTGGSTSNCGCSASLPSHRSVSAAAASLVSDSNCPVRMIFFILSPVSLFAAALKFPQSNCNAALRLSATAKR